MKGFFEGENIINAVTLGAVIYIYISSIYKILGRQCGKTKYFYDFVEIRNKGHPIINNILKNNRNKILIGG